MRDASHTRGGGGRFAAVAAAVAALALSVAPGASAAKRFVPPHHRVFHGVTDTGDPADFRTFENRIGTHSAVLEDFYHWGTPVGTGALQRWAQTRTRGVLSLSTAPGGKPEVISPGQIAAGHGDSYLLGLNKEIANSHQVVYIRLFGEMNGSWNPYCAFNSNGTRRGPSHSTAKFRKAWRRVVLIVRGGKRRVINRHLRRLGMPRLLRASSNHDRVYARHGVPATLSRPQVAFIWSPQTSGSPLVRGNSPSHYWPGRRYVDWVGADIYSKYATRNAWRLLDSFYRRYRRWPFSIGEYSPWDRDPHARFVKHLFKWARSHGRTRMLIYYRSVSPDSAFDISKFPADKRALRKLLRAHRFMRFAPGTG
jgi:hypothetical protein